jgi:hypothetical protein
MSVRGPLRAAPLLWAALLLYTQGCAPTREANGPTLSPSYRTSKDGGFSYRLPSGWFDASADSQARGHSALLIRNDYRATIAIDEVRLDDAARSEMRRNGLLPVAQLLLSLTSWEQHAVLAIAPHLIRLGDRPACRYRTVSGSTGDMADVTVVEGRAKLYTIRILISGKSADDENALQLVQESFLGSVRW